MGLAPLRRILLRTARGPSEVVLGPLGVALPAAFMRGRPQPWVLDRTVAHTHAATLTPPRRDAPALEITGGESCKDMATLATILDHLARSAPRRDAVVVACGGGTVGDVAGLAAALFLRGVDLVLVPTTLLAMVDASVGGKTAIDLPHGKNLVGAFHPARLVVIDTAFLATLPPRELRCGLGEVAKVALGLDAALFDFAEQNATALRAGDIAAMGEVIERCVRAKAAIVERDEHEAGERRLLNLGHTLGHALELAVPAGALSHGEAVAIGLRFALDLARREGAIDDAVRARGHALLDALGLPSRPPRVDPARVGELMSRDKKAIGARVRFVMPTGIGRCELRDVELDTLAAAAARWLATTETAP